MSNYIFYKLINNAIVSEVQSTKFLGIIIDSNLKWTEHINLIKTKISKGIGIIAKARKYLKQSTLITNVLCFHLPSLNLLYRSMGFSM